MEDFKSCFYEGKTQKWKENFSKGGGGTKRYLSLSEWRVIYYIVGIFSIFYNENLVNLNLLHVIDQAIYDGWWKFLSFYLFYSS